MTPEPDARARGWREKVDTALFGFNPGYLRHSIRLRLPGPARADGAAASAYLAAASAGVALSAETHRDHLAAWRAAYAAFGMRDATPPPEALLAWAIRPGGLPSQGALRDLIHGFTLAHGVPLAAYALTAIEGDLWLRPSRGSERFTGLGDRRPSAPSLGEIILSDTAELVLARHWHGAQAVETVAGPEASEVLVHLDLLPPAADAADGLLQAFLDLAERLLGASGEHQLLHRAKPEIAWPTRPGA
ncbi:MAG: hypothetical protein KDH92_03665 [Chloroflexi bacterium]|nr:hypothetical protein [Chloroflexota bacterium]